MADDSVYLTLSELIIYDHYDFFLAKIELYFHHYVYRFSKKNIPVDRSQ